MGLSARTDDNTGLPIGEGFIKLSTSAGNALIFRDPASANYYLQNNAGQFYKGGNNNNAPDGDFNDQSQAPAES